MGLFVHVLIGECTEIVMAVARFSVHVAAVVWPERDELYVGPVGKLPNMKLNGTVQNTIIHFTLRGMLLLLKTLILQQNNIQTNLAIPIQS
jgi:hypothetical protein